MKTTKKPRRASRRTAPRGSVWVVSYRWDYEGESVEAVYATKRDAQRHPVGGDETMIRKFKVLRTPNK